MRVEEPTIPAREQREMRHVLAPLLLVLAVSSATFAATDPADSAALAARLADWRSRSLPDSVETLGRVAAAAGPRGR
jgi:hypothetical protein